MSIKTVLKTQKQLIAENANLEALLKVAKRTLRDIQKRKGESTDSLGDDYGKIKPRVSTDRGYEMLIDNMDQGVLTLTIDGEIMYANRCFAEMLKTTKEKVIGSTIQTWIAPNDLQTFNSLLRKKTGENLRDQLTVTASDGTLVPISLSVSKLPINKLSISFALVVTDLTKGKMVEEITASEKITHDLSSSSEQSRNELLNMYEIQNRTEQALYESENRFRALVENNVDAITLLDANGITLYDSPAAPGMLGYGPEDWIGRNVFSLIHPDDLPRIMDLYKELVGIPGNRINCIFRVHHKNESWLWIEMVATNLLSEASVNAIVLNYRDITKSIQAEARIQRQLDHLTSLSEIERTISSNFDIKLSLSEILTQAIKELAINAADILLLDPYTKTLELAAMQGFRSKAVKKTYLRLGESYAGRAALERKLVQIPNLKTEPDTRLLSTIADEDDFVCYYGVPLINKGQVKGVLEIFHRTTLDPDTEWFEFLQALAGQAAIAIENATLYEGLQRSNQELVLAYDATIEGWSRALDLRDKETEGHTLRVTDMTVKLASSFELTDMDMKQIRWGALLHDIGKMGIPDEILLKPGPLTDEEWEKMKKHPTFAFDMLSPIRYLRQALDIPYSHHERWDGTGYPKGLKGTQIPLSARIFAVADVWDALGSDRPYRKAWLQDKVIELIKSSSGTHFDPQVVEKFLSEIHK